MMVSPGPAGPREHQGQGLSDVALVGLAVGRLLVEVNVLCETHQGLRLHVGPKLGI